jgi:long-chain acyl-CoA synthetase
VQLSDFDASSSLVSLFLSRADELGDKPMLWSNRDGQWTSISWAEAARRAE